MCSGTGTADGTFDGTAMDHRPDHAIKPLEWELRQAFGAGAQVKRQQKSHEMINGDNDF